MELVLRLVQSIAAAELLVHLVGLALYAILMRENSYAKAYIHTVLNKIFIREIFARIHYGMGIKELFIPTGYIKKDFLGTDWTWDATVVGITRSALYWLYVIIIVLLVFVY